jgi:hypothetical protein
VVLTAWDSAASMRRTMVKRTRRWQVLDVGVSEMAVVHLPGCETQADLPPW